MDDTCLPTSFDGIKIVGERTGDDPNLRQTKLVLAYDTWRPHVYTCFCSVILTSRYVSNRMLQFISIMLKDNLFVNREKKKKVELENYISFFSYRFEQRIIFTLTSKILFMALQRFARKVVFGIINVSICFFKRN